MRKKRKKMNGNEESGNRRAQLEDALARCASGQRPTIAQARILGHNHKTLAEHNKILQKTQQFLCDRLVGAEQQLDFEREEMAGNITERNQFCNMICEILCIEIRGIFLEKEELWVAHSLESKKDVGRAKTIVELFKLIIQKRGGQNGK